MVRPRCTHTACTPSHPAVSFPPLPSLNYSRCPTVPPGAAQRPRSLGVGMGRGFAVGRERESPQCGDWGGGGGEGGNLRVLGLHVPTTCKTKRARGRGEHLEKERCVCVLGGSVLRCERQDSRQRTTEGGQFRTSDDNSVNVCGGRHRLCRCWWGLRGSKIDSQAREK